ncbi:MAG TPA: helix-turn-helix domain-containing protein, partial [Spirochaetota bacterium]|nr:helix-turn-helix domain-containing protein [Spirochaetota bacterium]
MARPREFDKDEALYNAMLMFWKKGYDGTSIPDLLDATGISRSSLYETFTDKQTLFLEAMNRYRQFIGTSSIQIILDYLADSGRKNEPAMDVLRKYFNGRIDMAL